MKTIATLVAFATFIAAPAFAQAPPKPRPASAVGSSTTQHAANPSAMHSRCCWPPDRKAERLSQKGIIIVGGNNKIGSERMLNPQPLPPRICPTCRPTKMVRKPLAPNVTSVRK